MDGLESGLGLLPGWPRQTSDRLDIGIWGDYRQLIPRQAYAEAVHEGIRWGLTGPWLRILRSYDYVQGG